MPAPGFELRRDTSSAVTQLTAVLTELRWAGCLHCAVWLRGSNALLPEAAVRPLVDACAQAADYQALGAHWLEIEHADATALLTHLLSHDLAYRLRIMSDEQAAALVKQFFDLLIPPSRYFTNYASVQDVRTRVSLRHDPIGSYPITPATFDSGLVIIGADRIGMIWVLDED